MSGDDEVDSNDEDEDKGDEHHIDETPDEVNAKIDPRVFDAMIPKIDPRVFDAMIPKIDPRVFDAMIPKIDPRVFEEVATHVSYIDTAVFVKIAEGIKAVDSHVFDAIPTRIDQSVLSALMPKVGNEVFNKILRELPKIDPRIFEEIAANLPHVEAGDISIDDILSAIDLDEYPEQVVIRKLDSDTAEVTYNESVAEEPNVGLSPPNLVLGVGVVRGARSDGDCFDRKPQGDIGNVRWSLRL